MGISSTIASVFPGQKINWILAGKQRKQKITLLGFLLFHTLSKNVKRYFCFALTLTGKTKGFVD